jgi:hypothetical protein
MEVLLKSWPYSMEVACEDRWGFKHCHHLPKIFYFYVLENSSSLQDIDFLTNSTSSLLKGSNQSKRNGCTVRK